MMENLFLVLDEVYRLVCISWKKQVFVSAAQTKSAVTGSAPLPKCQLLLLADRLICASLLI